MCHCVPHCDTNAATLRDYAATSQLVSLALATLENPLNLIIRNEVIQDIADIRSVTKAAFRDHPHSSQTEHFIVDCLRKQDALFISLVATLNGRLVGHIAISPVVISDESTGWFAIDPLSVSPDMQNQKIGTALINTAIDKLKTQNTSGCVLVGDPEFYSRFGFKTYQEFVYPQLPQEYFQALSFGAKIPSGSVAFHRCFDAKG